MSDSSYALEKLRSLRDDINLGLQNYFNSAEAKKTIAPTKHSQAAFNLLHEFSKRPAKRVRGSLAVVSYRMFGGKHKQTAMNLAVAIELIQDHLLIIDDVMDRSQTRRGKATIHEQYLKKLHNLPAEESGHMSNMLAINVGLLAEHMASKILASINELPKCVLRATDLFHQNINMTGYGQIEDLFNTFTSSPYEINILTTYALKSSHYTFINPLQCGAALAGADESTLQALYDFGLPAGVVFQLSDDIIGLFGHSKKTGKSNLDDIREGKMTVLVQQVLANGSNSEVKTIKSALGNPNVTQEQGRKIRKIVSTTGSRQYAEALAAEYAKRAEKVLDGQKWPDVRFLRGILEYAVQRDH